MKNDIEELKAMMDTLIMETIEIQAQLSTVKSMVLGVLKDTLTTEQYKRVYTQYVDLLEQNVNAGLEGVQDGLFARRVVHRQLGVLSAIRQLRDSEDYIRTASGERLAQ